MPVFVDLPDDSLLNNAIRLAESRSGLITMQPTPVRKLDEVLYEDLKNHFPELWHSVMDFDSGLTSAKFVQFKTTFITMQARAINLLRENFGVPFRGPNEPSVDDLVRSVIFTSIGKRQDEWPNLYSRTRKEPAVQSAARNESMTELASRFNVQYPIIREAYAKLSQQVESALNSYKSLKGACSFLD